MEDTRVASWDIFWHSTPAERYDENLSSQINALVEASGLEVLEWYGGSWIEEETEGGLTSDNGVVVSSTRSDALALADEIRNLTGRNYDVREEELDDE